MVRLVALLILVLSLAACDGRGDGVSIRVANASALDFSSVFVNGVAYGAVEAGGASAYRAFETAYRYGSVQVVAEGDTYEIVPIDYVGEVPLGPGRYTYELDVRLESLELTLRED